jgi:hypothetical protein
MIDGEELEQGTHIPHFHIRHDGNQDTFDAYALDALNKSNPHWGARSNACSLDLALAYAKSQSSNAIHAL